jgi:hypothetical protein
VRFQHSLFERSRQVSVRVLRFAIVLQVFANPTANQTGLISQQICPKAKLKRVLQLSETKQAG